MPEPAPHTAPGSPAPADTGGHRDVPPYRARASHTDGGAWLLAVESLKDHPDRGEVDSVVVTVTASRLQGGHPPADVDAALSGCGFRRDGSWTRHDDGWSAPCAQTDAGAAPPAPPTGGRHG